MPPTEHWLPSLILQSTSATLPISKQSSYPQYHGANSKMLLHQMNYTHLVLKKQIKFFFGGGGVSNSSNILEYMIMYILEQNDSNQAS